MKLIIFYFDIYKQLIVMKCTKLFKIVSTTKNSDLCMK